MINPHYPRIIIAFEYRDCLVEIERDTFQEMEIYSVWVNYGVQSVVAVPFCYSKVEAIRKGIQWIDTNLILAENIVPD